MGTRTPNFDLYKPDAGEGTPTDPIADVLNSNWDTIDANLGGGGGSGKLHIQNTEPSNPSDGDVWIDTS